MLDREDEPRVDTNVLVDSKREYIEQLDRSLSQPVFNAFKNILQDAMNVSEAKDLDELDCLSQLLSEVPSWNADIVDEETREIMKTAPYLKELLKAYFVCASMILGSIRKSQNSDQRLRVKVPTSERFIHSVMKMMAADIGDDIPHFISQTEDGEFKLNKRHTMKLAGECVRNSLHSFMPIDDILKDYMDGIMGEDAPPPPRPQNTDNEVQGGTKSVRLGSNALRHQTKSYAEEDDGGGDEEIVIEEDEDF
eukprot:jgi/Mesvir1/18613/Mv17122-RA.1